MGMKKIKKKVNKALLKAYKKGFDSGYDVATENYHEVWLEGVQVERKRIISLFKMLSDSELEHGSGNKAKFWKEAADVVKVADELEVFDEDGESLDYE